MQKKEKCKINTSSVLKQIINERDSPLSIFREAISNSFDANASHMNISAEEREERQINIIFHDNGKGMNSKELQQFFNVGYTSKDDSKIGEKGLGTKLFFNSERVEVKTVKDGKGLEGILNSPLDYLRSGEIPHYEIKEVDELPFSRGTEIKLLGVKTHNRREIFWGNKLKNYLRWKTAAGSIRRFFENGKKMEVNIEVSDGNKNKSYTITGHPLPETNRVDNSDVFAFRFDPFEFDIELPSRKSKVQVVGSIVGPEAHIVQDKRMKKKYKGIFLCKDYFPIRSVNEEVFGNSGEWQSMHILVNCQDLELTMGREDFVNKEEEGTIFKEVIKRLKVFKNSVLNGEPFEWKGQKVEKTDKYAGRGYEQLQTLKQRQKSERLDCRRATKIIQKKNNVKRFKKDSLPIAFEPSDKLSTFSLFLTLLGSESLDNSYKIFDVGEENDRLTLLMSQNNGSGLTEPRYYTVYKTFTKQLLNHLDGNYDGVICWDFKNISPKNENKLKDFIRLKEFV